MASEDKTLRFAPFSSFVNSSFWFKFADVKLEDDRLNEVTRHIWGYYSQSEKTNAVLIDCTSFNKSYDVCFSRCYCHGYHINKNTAEGFKNYDKSKLIKEYGSSIIRSIQNGEAVKDPSLLVTFVLLTYCDLKKYVFTYWFAFPALLQSQFYLGETPVKLDAILSSEQVVELSHLHSELPLNQKGFFCFCRKSQNISIFSLNDFISNLERNVNEFNVKDDVFWAFLDPCLLDEVPGWPLRNYLILLKHYCADAFRNEFKIVSLRGEASEWLDRSYIFSVRSSENVSLDLNNYDEFIGWQKNDKGKLHPKQINLSDDMDPKRLSSRAVTLNLKLVKWRLQPDLDLTIMENTSCLLLGAGTLGCSVARVLLAWGVKKITFVDSGVISYSNPARQSLYTFEDSTKALPKAVAAARALQLIHPGMDVTGEVLRIPIPGKESSDVDHVHKLTELIRKHDAVFLLTDSRESRWLPTVLCSYFNKIAITIALGYDSYLIMRHGISEQNCEEKLGCYFCNDVVAPGNSTVDRTLDQQCTVTRPGLSGIASSFGVELFVALLQHPKKGLAPGNSDSCLGKIPHSIRGFIADYEVMLPLTTSFNQCIACSSTIMKEYEREGENFLLKVFADRKYLEQITALSQYQLLDDQLDFPDSSDTDET
ncbi:ubiquitin-like modifier-activating enzyme ATG7 isoform X2 [Planococcus citri]|uniref:ubiquitin-like modifier-activating enzyme ATG7 isoform X2 n=1 Tax=Planococcus citri TaxID=170843 RepID=UPI0031F751B9